ncbi:MAG: aminopeptidase P family protein [Lachnospiraceae bacterium]|nr:aminopeptidase P family protein [Lachnospiraceae bacterium]
MNVVAERINRLREVMKSEGADWYLITSDDYHTSEYVSDFFKVREYYTGFTGDNAYLLLNGEKALMWTDGRFFIQADKELKDTGVELMKMATDGYPSLTEYIEKNIKNGEKLYFDGRTVSTSLGKQIGEILEKNGASSVSDKDLAGDLWDGRPALPSGKVWHLSLEEAGESFADKLKRTKAKVSEEGCNSLFIAKLDDIMWLTNLRGDDIVCNPVALSYMMITEKENVLFLQESETTEEIREYLSKEGIEVRSYDDVIGYLSELSSEYKVLVDEGAINYASYLAVNRNAKSVNRPNPTTYLKAVKSAAELKNIREITILDSVCVTKFAYWVKKNIGKIEITELSAAEKMDGLRREVEGYLDLSFPTIAGYGENAAMMHYSATPESFAVCKPEGLLLVDSGGQYRKGTTDVTRTFVLGPISDEVKMHFSKVAAGMLRLANVKFLYGCTGRNLDIIARMPLWEQGIDYKCGTGHGVGYILNVHEGPHGIRWAYNPRVKEAVFEEGMIVSDEPGVYIEGSHGIRTENVIECVKREKNSDGQWMGFEHLTYTPIDRDALDKKYLTKEDVALIDAYHEAVYEKTAKFLTEEERAWLYEVTRPL